MKLLRTTGTVIAPERIRASAPERRTEATQQPEATASQRHGSLHALSFRDDGALVELRLGEIGGVNRKGQKARIPTGIKVREERVGRRYRVTRHEGVRHRILLGLLARVVFRANE